MDKSLRKNNLVFFRGRKGFQNIAVDADDHPHITFYEYRGPKGTNITDRLRMVSWNGNFWEVQTIDSDGQSGKFNGIAIDSHGYIHVGYANVSAMTAGMRYGFWDGKSWKTEEIDGFKKNEGETVGYSACIALDKDDVPHVAYMNINHPALKYAVHENGVWHVETVDLITGVGYPDRNSIAIYNSTPYISYYDSGSGILKLAHRDGKRWHTVTIDGNGAGFTSSVQISQNGIWISYADDGSRALKVAHRDLTADEITAASASAGRGNKLAEQVGH
jgi:hypothetical protein